MGLANAASMLVPAVDAWAMGSLGRDALAGGGLGAGILSATMLVTGGVLAIVSPLVAEARTRAAASHSAPAPAGGERAIVGSAIVVAVALGALSTAALVLSSDALFEILGAPAAVARPGGAYLRAAAPSLVPALVAAAMRQALNASGRARHVLVASLAVLAAKAVANVGVVTVLRDVGTPALGVAAVAAQLLMAGVLARTARVEIGRPSSAGVRLVLRLGLPIGVTTGLEVAFFALSGAPIARLGADALAAHEIALQTLFLAFVIPLTFAQATSIRVAAGVGGASPAEVRAAAAAGVTLSLACAGIVALALAAGAPALAAAAAGAAPSALTARLLRLAAVVHLFDALQVSLAFVLRGLRDTRAPAAICVVTYGFLGPGLALAMIRTAPWAGAIWYAFTVTLAVTALAYGFRLHSRLQALAHH
ncbi:MAG: hypothetical protein JST00_06775 [Deltaproteobacteria bacterium]|nr:hypothetical protein [Deltaproteobacteria bacterium]